MIYARAELLFYCKLGSTLISTRVLEYSSTEYTQLLQNMCVASHSVLGIYIKDTVFPHQKHKNAGFAVCKCIYLTAHTLNLQ